MDIDPLWAIGGCRFFSSICMAETKKPSSSSPPSSLSSKEGYTKSPPFLLLLSLLFILLLLAHPSYQIRHFNMVSKPVAQSLSTASPSFTSSTSSFQPKTPHQGKTSPSQEHGKTSPSKELEASDHEVPSGPNPISNR